MSFDHTAVRLGKHAPKIDERTLRLAKYLSPALPAPPGIVDWTMGLKDWGAMKNDSLGDCTCAAVGHAIQLFTGNVGQMVTIPDSAVVAAYSAVSGYDPRTGRNDNGAVELDVLNYWTKTGVGGHKITAYASIEANGNLDLPTLQQAVYLFGAAYIGVALPQSAQGQDIWDVAGPLNRPNNAPGSWGGHAIIIVSGVDNGGKPQFQVVTWGGLMPVTSAFMEAYCDEAYAVLSPDWLDAGKAGPNCLDMATLQADLQAVKAA